MPSPSRRGDDLGLFTPEHTSHAPEHTKGAPGHTAPRVLHSTQCLGETFVLHERMRRAPAHTAPQARPGTPHCGHSAQRRNPEGCDVRPPEHRMGRAQAFRDSQSGLCVRLSAHSGPSLGETQRVHPAGWLGHPAQRNRVISHHGDRVHGPGPGFVKHQPGGLESYKKRRSPARTRRAKHAPIP